MAGQAEEIRCLWYLEALAEGGRCLRRVPILRSRFIIGRRDSLGLSIPSTLVSSRHAELVQTGERLLLRDLDSSSGTFVDRRRVDEALGRGARDDLPRASQPLLELAAVVGAAVELGRLWRIHSAAMCRSIAGGRATFFFFNTRPAEINAPLAVPLIAEGLERRQEVAVCRDLGIAYGQGYFFGPAVQPETLHDPFPAEEES